MKDNILIIIMMILVAYYALAHYDKPRIVVIYGCEEQVR